MEQMADSTEHYPCYKFVVVFKRHGNAFMRIIQGFFKISLASISSGQVIVGKNGAAFVTRFEANFQCFFQILDGFIVQFSV